jgi:hypothetical protein
VVAGGFDPDLFCELVGGLPERMVLAREIHWPAAKEEDVLMKVGRNDSCPCQSGLKFKKCCGASEAKPARNVELQAFRSDRVIFTVQNGSETFKVLQIVFPPDGSIFANFPYFRHRTGILASACLPQGNYPIDINLELAGKVASHLVKYSHHPDGRVHFSQDGKVLTQIKRQGVALEKQTGHLFSVMIQGVEGFDKAVLMKDKAPPSPKRTTLNFQLDPLKPDSAIKLIVRRYELGSLQWGPQVQGKVGPVVPTQDSDGKQLPAFVVAGTSPETRHVLFVTCEHIPRSQLRLNHFFFTGVSTPLK